MKLKTLIVTVVVLAALSVAAYFLNRPPPSPAADPRVGRPLVDRAIVDQAAQLRLTADGKTVQLVRQPDASWRVASYYDLPADFDKLSRFVTDLANAKIQRFVTANPERIDRLDFKDHRIELLDPAGHALWSLTLGKNADTGGVFVRFDDEPKTYLASLDPLLDTDAKNWADSALLNLKPADIARVEIGFDGAPAVTVSRAKADAPFTAAATPAGRQLATDKINSLLEQFTNLRFSDTADQADPDAIAAKQHSRTLKLTTFSGKTYTLALGRKPEEEIARPAEKTPAARPAATSAGAPPKPAAPETETVPAGPVFAFIASSDAAAPVNAMMQKRAFEIYDYSYTSLPEKPADLFVAAAPPPPAKPAAPAAKPPAKP